jgi:hypothetical protein
MFADALLRPTRYSVIATPNLNGDYLSDATAAQVGGLGIAPGANLGDTHAIFEATHGTAPDIAGKNLANPCSLLLSGVMMLEYLGWDEAARIVVAAIEKTIGAKTVTGDLARLMSDATSLSTDQFALAIVANMTAIGDTLAGNKPADPKLAGKAEAGPAHEVKVAALSNLQAPVAKSDSGATRGDDATTGAGADGLKRYFVRELIPRALLLTLTFKWLMPLASFGLLKFNQGWGAASVFGIAFTVMFWMLGSVIMGSQTAQHFLASNKKSWWFIPANIALVLGAPALGLALATLAAPATLVVSGWAGLLAGSVVLNLACALTHDYRANAGN